jgi:hypothetical protein
LTASSEVEFRFFVVLVQSRIRIKTFSLRSDLRRTGRAGDLEKPPETGLLSISILGLHVAPGMVVPPDAAPGIFVCIPNRLLIGSVRL